MKIGLFGGTFDPVHTGHLLMAEAAREACGLDRVIFLPTFDPPHKNKPAASSRDRIAMLRLAIRGNPALHLNDWEIRQRRIVYTWEALAHFRALWPKADLYFILGTDSLQSLPLWRQGARLLREARFVAIERPSFPWKRLPAALRRKCRLAASIPVPMASHDIRARVRSGRSIRYQVPLAVERYIRSRGLYRRAR